MADLEGGLGRVAGRRLAWLVGAMALILFGSVPSQPQSLSPAARHIQSYYQQLLPTIQQAGQLSVRERERLRRLGDRSDAARRRL